MGACVFVCVCGSARTEQNNELLHKRGGLNKCKARVLRLLALSLIMIIRSEYFHAGNHISEVEVGLVPVLLALCHLDAPEDAALTVL